MTTITRILVPVDFEETSREALAYAAMLAERMGAALSLVHVFDDVYASGAYAPDVYAPLPPAVRERVIGELQQKLSALLPATGGHRNRADVIVGTPANGIVESAREQGADLIVMGTHGRRGLSHALLGSVAERVLRTASCPVLTVRRPASAAHRAA
jgi:nucleotide-binding universal stress UspA family protein